MADGVLRRATRRDRQFVGWGQFGIVVTMNVLLVTSVAAVKHAAGGACVPMGALVVLCPLLGLHQMVRSDGRETKGVEGRSLRSPI